MGDGVVAFAGGRYCRYMCCPR